MVEFDVSLDVLYRIEDNGNIGQVGATCYGPLVCYDTSAPQWVYSDGTLVTIVFRVNTIIHTGEDLVVIPLQ